MNYELISLSLLFGFIIGYLFLLDKTSRMLEEENKRDVEALFESLFTRDMKPSYMKQLKDARESFLEIASIGNRKTRIDLYRRAKDFLIMSDIKLEQVEEIIEIQNAIKKKNNKSS